MEEMLEKIFLITSGGNEPRPASSVRRVQNTCDGSYRGTKNLNDLDSL